MSACGWAPRIQFVAVVVLLYLRGRWGRCALQGMAIKGIARGAGLGCHEWPGVAEHPWSEASGLIRKLHGGRAAVGGTHLHPVPADNAVQLVVEPSVPAPKIALCERLGADFSGGSRLTERTAATPPGLIWPVRTCTEA